MTVTIRPLLDRVREFLSTRRLMAAEFDAERQRLAAEFHADRRRLQGRIHELELERELEQIKIRELESLADQQMTFAERVNAFAGDDGDVDGADYGQRKVRTSTARFRRGTT